MKENPLAGYFRKPMIHMSLPSQGNFYPEGSIEIPETGELPVYPMSALDEISYRTPDSLFNGSSVVEVIQSCIPSIKDPWKIPVIDLPAILANIRIASFGHMMEINTTCPKCKEHATYNLDLRQVVDSLKSPDFSESLKFGDIEVFFKPLNYKELNENNKLNFEENQMKRVIADTDIDQDEKLKLLGDAFRKVSKYTMETVAHNISNIRTPQANVDDYSYILNYLMNCPKNVYDDIKKHIVEIRKISEIKPLTITCSNDDCKTEYEQPFTLDMSTFFE